MLDVDVDVDEVIFWRAFDDVAVKVLRGDDGVKE